MDQGAGLNHHQAKRALPIRDRRSRCKKQPQIPGYTPLIRVNRLKNLPPGGRRENDSCLTVGPGVR